MTKDERLNALMGTGGLQQCGNSQNCVNACPKGIPLTTSIAAMNRETTFHMFKPCSSVQPLSRINQSLLKNPKVMFLSKLN